MSYYRVPSGSNLVLNVLLNDGNSGKYPLAYVYDDDFVEIGASPIALSHVAHGLYSNLSISVPDGRYIVVYVVFDDVGHTNPSGLYGRTTDTFDVNDIVDVNAISEGVWRETRAGNSPAGSFGEILDVKLSAIKAETAEIPAAKANTDTLVSRLTSARAANLDNLDVAVSTLPSAADNADAVWDEATAGHVTAGTFGARLDAAVSSRQSESDAATRYTALQGDIDGLGTVTATIAGDTTAIKAKTDQFAFSGGFVRAQADVVVDKTDYSLSTAGVGAVADGVWDEPMAGHLTAGTTGEKLNNGDASTDIPALADAVWDEARSGHVAAGSFGEALQGVLSTTRAGNLDNLDATITSRQSEANASARATNNQTEHDTTQSLLTNVQSTLGTPVGASLSADLVAIKGDTSTIDTKIGTPVTSVSGDIAAVDAKATTINGKADTIISTLGTPVGASLSVDIAAIKGDTSAIKAKTDSLSFTGSYVNAQVKVSEDKTGYQLLNTQIDSIADKVWDELGAAHTAVGSFGKIVQDTALGVNPSAIADAVWDELAADHVAAGSFGALLDALDHAVGDIHDTVHSGSIGLAVLKATVTNEHGTTRSEIDANETKIDAIIPAIAASQAAIISEIDDNQSDIGSLSVQLTNAEASINANVDVNETKIDALQSSVSSLSNNTTVRFIVPERMIRPSTGSKNYQFHLRLFDENGAPNAPDSAPTIRIRRLDTGVDVVSGASMTQDGVKVGAYYYDYTLLTSSFLAPVLVEVTVVDGGVTTYIPASSEITEFESDLTAVQAQLTSVETKVDASNSQLTSGVHGLSAIRTKQDDIVAEVDQNEVLLASLHTKVDAIPTDSASSTEVGTVLSAVNTKPSLGDITTVVNAARDNIKGIDGRDLTQVYDNMDLSLVMKTSDPRLANLDAPISSRSTLTVSQVWNHATRTLTQYGLEAANIKAIWDYLAADATVPNSLGKRLADYLDATISSRATAAQVSSELSGVAQETTVAGLESVITTENNENELLLNQVISLLNTIGAKTTNLPSDPASQSAVLGAVAGLSVVLANIDLRTTGIKTKTDNIPASPAQESTVAAIPTNPLLTTDSRLNNLSNLDAPVSSVVPADISNLATKADVSSGNIVIGNKVDTNKASLDDLHLKVGNIKTQTDKIPLQPSSVQDVNSARDDVISELNARGPELTASQVWSYGTREITQDPTSFGPDISGLAEKTDLDPLAPKQYVNRMTTTFNSSTGEQEILVWAEKDGQAVAGSDCDIRVLDGLGTLVWNGTLASPNSDGIFRFSHQWQPLAGRNYYVDITMTVDGGTRVTTQSFYTAG